MRTRKYEVQLRHAKYYLEVLQSLNRRLGQNENPSVIYDELQWGQIKVGYEWARRESSRSFSAEELFESYKRDGEPLLSLGDLPKDAFILEVQLRNSESFEVRCNLLKQLGDFYVRETNDRKAQKYFSQKLQLISDMKSLLYDMELNSLQDMALTHWRLKEYRLYTKLHRQIDSLLTEQHKDKLAHVFFSYSRKDTIIMRQIRDEFTRSGLDVWVDENIEPASNRWRDAVVESIKTAGCFVILLTPEAVLSEWVNKELIFAKIQGIAIFPIMVDGDKQRSVPIEIIDLQWAADLREKTKYEAEMLKLTDTIRTHLQNQIY